MVADAKTRQAARDARAKHAAKILELLRSGKSVAEIASQLRIGRVRVEAVLKKELSSISIAAAADFAKLQIARLDKLIVGLTAMGYRGDLAAIDRILKILDRLDRYHGFAAGKSADAGEAARARTDVLAMVSAARKRGSAKGAGG
jgi:predicted XRE-type DNA-binding protein